MRPAIYRDEERLHNYRGGGTSKASIDLYSCAGTLVRSIAVRCPRAPAVCFPLG